MGFYPIVLELGGRPCLVVGGGAVAERKGEALLEGGGGGGGGGASPGPPPPPRCALRGSGAAADADAWRRALDPALRRLIAEGREDEARARLLGRLRAAACA